MWLSRFLVKDLISASRSSFGKRKRQRDSMKRSVERRMREKVEGHGGIWLPVVNVFPCGNLPKGELAASGNRRMRVKLDRVLPDYVSTYTRMFLMRNEYKT